MITIRELIDFCQAQAIASKLRPGEESDWRYMCRQYSQKFHTPLHVVYELPPEEVILSVFEGQMDELEVEDNIENLLDVIYGLEDPEYEQTKKAQLEDFIDRAEEEEQERLKKGKPIHPAMRGESSLNPKNTPEKDSTAAKSLPTQGGINLSYLEKDENER